MTSPPGFENPQRLVPPKTRLTQAWSAAWSRYYGVAPRGLLRTKHVVIPAIRRQGYAHRVRR